MNAEKNCVAVMHCNKVGQCLRAKSDLVAGQVVLKEQAELQSQASTHSIQYERNTHAHTFEAGILKFAEHMCEPNCAVKINEAGSNMVGLQFIALKDISAGERLGFNYNTTDWAFCDPFECECGRASCGREIRGFSFMSAQQRGVLIEMVGDKYLSKVVLEEHLNCGEK